MKNSTLLKKRIEIIFIFLPLLMFFNVAKAQTNIGGVLSSNATLMLANSPYIVTNNLLVQQGVKITVEPGVIFKFNQGIYLQVDGEFQSIGTNSDSITFTKNILSGAVDWGGIRFTNTIVDYNSSTGNGCIIDHSIIEYAGTNNASAINLGNCNIKISSSKFRYLNGNVVLSNGNGHASITNNIIYDCTYMSISIDDNHWELFQGNEIYNITGISSNALIAIGRTIFNNNYIHDIPILDVGVRVRDTIIMNNNIFENIPHTAVLIQGGDAHILKCNTFVNNAINLGITCERYPLIINNNFLNYSQWNVYWSFAMYGPFSSFGCQLPSGSGTYATIDLANNYWGGLTNQQMDSSIWDFNDDFSLKALINYAPVLTDTVNYSQVDCSYPLAINEFTTQNENIEIFPNPFQDNAYLRIRGQLLNEKYQVAILNIFGNVVKNIQVTGSGLIPISGEDLSPGMYFCQIISPDKKRYAAKLIIQ